jgi:aspartate-semialdehyde dehydrogenase
MADAVVALVGGESLLGSDVREQIAQTMPRVRIKLVGSEDDYVITEDQGEATVMTPMDQENLVQARAVVLAGSVESSRKAWQLMEHGGCRATVVDLTTALEDRPEARLRAPWVEQAPPSDAGGLHVMAHPAAIVLVRLLRAARPVERAVVSILAPASEKGRAGVHELQQQTVQLLSFQPLAHDVFPSQLSFNVLAGTLASVERQIERHVASLLAAQAPAIAMPSIRVLQAPVMHGYGFSLWIEGAGDLDTSALDVWPDDPPHVAGIAGQSGVSVGAIERDRNNHRAVWLWAVADQFRVAADNATAVLERIV